MEKVEKLGKAVKEVEVMVEEVGLVEVWEEVVVEAAGGSSPSEQPPSLPSHQRSY